MPLSATQNLVPIPELQARDAAQRHMDMRALTQGAASVLAGLRACSR